MRPKTATGNIIDCAGQARFSQAWEEALPEAIGPKRPCYQQKSGEPVTAIDFTSGLEGRMRVATGWPTKK